MKKIGLVAVVLVILAGVMLLAPGFQTKEQLTMDREPAVQDEEGTAPEGGRIAETLSAGERRTRQAALPMSGITTGSNANRGLAVKEDAVLYMHIGSPVAYANGKLLSLDKDSPDLAPVLYKTRTLVPLRVISEYFGAEVGYDTDKAQATIRTADHEAVFPIGKEYYFLDGVRKPLDVETLMLTDRAFVPLREICQETLGYTVDYRDNLICVAKTAKVTEEVIRDVKSKIGMYVRAADLETLNRYMNGYADYGDRGRFEVDDFLDLEEMADADGAVAAPLSENTASSPAFQEALAEEAGYSSTNVQVEGIDEGDIVKTDGKYIYVIADNYLKVVEAQDMKLVGDYFLGEYSSAREMYIDGDRVTVIGSRYEERGGKPSPNVYYDAGIEPMVDVQVEVERAVDVIYDDYAYYGGSSFTFVRVLDTGNMASIKSLRYYEMEGYMNTSRKKGDFVYLVSGFSRWHRGGNGDIRPLTGENGNLEPLSVEKIMIMPGSYGEEFLTISAIDTRDVSTKVTSETIAGNGYVTYMSNDNLYIATYDHRYNDKETTNIARFSIDGAKIGYAGSGGVEGMVNNQFNMDEYQSYLRVASTVNWPNTYNTLYVLDANMDVAGKVEGYAEGERIYSARFMGTRGYVVTFRQVDPLFVFDLSEPASPKITGELKVPGFSSYLHPVSQNVVLGVGRDVYDIYRLDKDGNQVVVGQNTGGVKISLFDVSDMGKPKELDTLIMGNYGYAELLDNHRAAMFKSSDSLLGFCGYSDDNRSGEYFQGAYLITYADDKLSEVGRLAYENPYDEYDGNQDSAILYTGERLVYIGNTLYYMQDGLLRSYEMGTLAPKASLRLTRR